MLVEGFPELGPPSILGPVISWRCYALRGPVISWRCYALHGPVSFARAVVRVGVASLPTTPLLPVPSLSLLCFRRPLVRLLLLRRRRLLLLLLLRRRRRRRLLLLLLLLLLRLLPFRRLRFGVPALAPRRLSAVG